MRVVEKGRKDQATTYENDLTIARELCYFFLSHFLPLAVGWQM